jgi:peptidyl-tRNA hydrolase
VDVEIDTTAPAAPSIDSPADGSVTNDTTPTISGSGAEPGSTVTVRDQNDNVICVDSSVAGDGLWSCEASPPLAEGNYTFTATATDPTGNTSDVSNAVDVEVDTTNPDVTLTTPADSGLYNTSVVAVDYGLTEDNPGTTVCTITGPGGPYVVSPCTDGQNLPALPDGDFSIEVQHTDAAGNVGTSASHDFTIDTAAPSAPAIDSPADGSVTDDTTPTISGTGAEPGSTVTVRDQDDNVICVDSTVDVDGLWSCDASPDLAEGSYTFTATATDDAGNTSPVSNAVDVIVDTTAPAVTLTTPANNVTYNTSVVAVDFSLTETNPGTSVCTITGPGGPYEVDPCTDGQDLPALPDGDFSIEVQHTDAAGNVGTSASHDFTIDTTAPSAPTIDSPADGSVTNDTTPTISGNGAEAGSTVTVRDQNNNVICTDTSVGVDGLWSCDASPALSQGDYTFTATSTDDAGNTSAESNAVDVKIDATAPSAPTITSPADNTVTNDTTPTISGNGAEAGSTVTVRDQNNNVICTDTSVGVDGLWSCDASPVLSQGDYTFTATATDDASNTSAASNAVDLEVDATNPAVTLTTPANNATYTTSVVAVDYSLTENNPGTTLCTITGPGGPYVVSPCTDGSNLPALPDGDFSIQVQHTDAAGNVGTSNAHDFTIDTADHTAPSPPTIDLPTDDTVTADSTPTISGSGAEPGSTVTVRDQNNAVVCVDTSVVADGLWSCDASPALADGSYTLTAKATDAANNESAASNAVDITVDTTPPPAPTIASPVDGATIADNTPTITGTGGQPNGSILVYVDGVVVCTTTANGSGSWSCTPGGALSDGPHTLTATTKDPAGNESSPSTAVHITVDTTPPHGNVVQETGSGANGENPTFDISSDDPTATTTCSLDGGASYACSSPHTPPGKLTPGTHTLTVTFTDGLGNSSQETITFVIASGTTDPLPEQCFKKGITIIDLGPKGKKVTLRGFARLSYVGQKVTIRYKGTPKKVTATAVVQPDGSFVSTFKAPAKKLWLTNKARYQASVGNEKTAWMKLSRRVRTATATFANGKLTVKGELVKPLMPKASATVKARTGCDGPWKTIGATKVSRAGRFSTSIPYVPETGIVFVRISTVVSSSAKKPKPARTFSYVIPVVLTR